jgi:hypothetical protein
MKLIVIAAAALVLVSGCSPHEQEQPADKAGAAGEQAGEAMQQRAQKAVGGSAPRVSETLAPFHLAADRLGGRTPLAWGVAVNRALVTAAFPAETPPRATMEFEKSNGSIDVSISGANGWQFYFECDARNIANVPELWFNWVAQMSPQSQARNRATYDPATKRWFFATPVANAADNGVVRIIFWASESSAPAETRWLLHGCTILPFKVSA